ncbi:hypothetical protein N7462_009943 [Penicillium macrosclerotiorum]|uniref:uncharacterized protein n=1 Tax=Penicillium macrosclerotiorum TaxID=303699 RepID=UPI002549673D|nr:uncharacterized protein N7462_009943 [Penicillium macrosclerotiorum]KAJ5668873.1 hypothetical protein N7462_009943 [Penicillium macrosclerotiorum]
MSDSVHGLKIEPERPTGTTLPNIRQFPLGWALGIYVEVGIARQCFLPEYTEKGHHHTRWYLPGTTALINDNLSMHHSFQKPAAIRISVHSLHSSVPRAPWPPDALNGPGTYPLCVDRCIISDNHVRMTPTSPTRAQDTQPSKTTEHTAGYRTDMVAEINLTLNPAPVSLGEWSVYDQMHACTSSMQAEPETTSLPSIADA